MNIPAICFLLAFVPAEQSENNTATIIGKITPPVGFTLIGGEENSFSNYLSCISLKKDNTVYLYNGTKKANQDAQYAVLDVDVGKRDLQQCADAVIRLRAEYLYSLKKHDAISFHFVNGQECAWIKYAEGNRPVFKGNKFSWHKQAAKDYTHSTFRKYMDLVFGYAGTASLIKDLNTVKNMSEIIPGDVLIQSRNPYGHAVIVVAVARNPAGEKRFLLAQSYMPAQDIHILKNPQSTNPWYEAKAGEIWTPEWTFYSGDLRRWP